MSELRGAPPPPLARTTLFYTFASIQHSMTDVTDEVPTSFI